MVFYGGGSLKGGSEKKSRDRWVGVRKFWERRSIGEEG